MSRVSILCPMFFAFASAVYGAEPIGTAEEQLADAFTVYSFGPSAFSHAPPILGVEARIAFSEGSEQFRQQRSIESQSHHNATSCATCHFLNGRGQAHSDRFEETGFSVPASSEQRPTFRKLTRPDNLVSNLQGVIWRKSKTIVLPDGLQVELVQPISLVDERWKSANLRNAPAVIGLGMLEAIPEEALIDYANKSPYRNIGIRGKLAASESQGRVGRFGWKASFSSLEAQVANAISFELGAVQDASNASKYQLQRLTDYMRTLAVPARRISSRSVEDNGARTFYRIGCEKCHKATWRTGADSPVAKELRNLKIYPFTDLLLHDLGHDLKDSSTDVLSSLWRTAPLWGIGMQSAVSKKVGFLHDGRARNILEAVLWHGGEAEEVSQQFRRLPKQEREQLLRFLSSL